MSDIDILKEAYETLDSLNIPVKYLETLAIPIANVSNRLKILHNAVVQAYQKQSEETVSADPVNETETETEN